MPAKESFPASSPRGAYLPVSHPQDFDSGAPKRFDHLIARLHIGNQHVKVRGLADAPPSNLTELAVVDNCDPAAGELDHGGVQICLIGAEAARAPRAVDAIGSDEERVDEHRLKALNRGWPHQRKPVAAQVTAGDEH